MTQLCCLSHTPDKQQLGGFYRKNFFVLCFNSNCAKWVLLVETCKLHQSVGISISPWFQQKDLKLTRRQLSKYLENRYGFPPFLKGRDLPTTNRSSKPTNQSRALSVYRKNTATPEEREGTDQLSPVPATIIRGFYQVSVPVRKMLTVAWCISKSLTLSPVSYTKGRLGKASKSLGADVPTPEKNASTPITTAFLHTFPLTAMSTG